MIERTSNIDSLYGSYDKAPQLTNLWDFYLEDWVTGSKYSLSRFNMVGTSLPFMVSLETDSFNTGENYYSDFKYPNTFSVELREDTSFSVYDYFKYWMLEVFDPVTGNFISNRDINPKPRNKTGYIQFYSYKMNPKAYSLFSEQYIVEKLKGMTARASQTLIEQAKRVANKNVPYPLSLGLSQAASIASLKVQSGIASLMPEFSEMIEEVVTKSFTLENVRFLGMDDTSLSYSDGEQMVRKINLIADRFYDTDMSKNHGNLLDF